MKAKASMVNIDVKKFTYILAFLKQGQNDDFFLGELNLKQICGL